MVTKEELAVAMRESERLKDRVKKLERQVEALRWSLTKILESRTWGES